jgi:plasmid stabilization system protein ParE
MNRYQLRLSSQALGDLERLQDFLRHTQSPLAQEWLAFVIDALDVLTHQPGIGRPMPGGLRELIIKRGHSGYLAQYRIDEAAGVVQVARVRHQRESGYPEEQL